MNIKISDLCFSFGDLHIFNNFNITIKEAKVTVLLGPSGCGKTTLLNLISGFLQPSMGSIKSPKNKQLSYLFQEPRLLPWKTVEENILFVLDKLDTGEQKARLKHYLKALDLTDFKDYYPNQLSGGMKQRVSIARAFAYPSDIVLMDEPFKGLDLRLKLNLITSFNKVWKEEKRTVVFVTHDIQEATLLGDTIVVLSKAPSVIRNIYANELEHTQRFLYNPKLLFLEKELFSMLS